MDRHLTYVSMTRHRDGVALYAGRDEFSDMGALAGRLSRAQLKETTLDYGRTAAVRAVAAQEIDAQRRGMDRAPQSEIVIQSVQKAQETPERERAVERPTQKRSMFDGLKLGGGRSVPEAERPAPAKAADTLHQAVDSYARAYDDAARMRAQGLPILDHQRLALRDAGQKLDAVRPGAHADLKIAAEHNPDVATALRTMQGQPGTALLVSGIRQEERIRQDPNLHAERLVKVWNGLEAEHRRLKG